MTGRTVTALAAGLLVLGVGIQMIPLDRSAPAPADPLHLDPEVASLIEGACFDCHSSETAWPWYSRVAPVSWWVADHVAEGREHLNFSTWGTLSLRDRDHAFEEIVEVIDEGEMPLRSYTLIHSEARLDAADRSRILAWARAERARLNAESAESDDPER